MIKLIPLWKALLLLCVGFVVYLFIPGYFVCAIAVLLIKFFSGISAIHACACYNRGVVLVSFCVGWRIGPCGVVG